MPTTKDVEQRIADLLHRPKSTDEKLECISKNIETLQVSAHLIMTVLLLIAEKLIWPKTDISWTLFLVFIIYLLINIFNYLKK